MEYEDDWITLALEDNYEERCNGFFDESCFFEDSELIEAEYEIL